MKAKKTRRRRDDDDDRKRCARCGLAVVKSPYGRWKHAGNKQSGKGCGQPPEVQ